MIPARMNRQYNEKKARGEKRQIKVESGDDEEGLYGESYDQKTGIMVPWK